MPNKQIFKQVTVAASPDVVWRKWTTNAGIKSFLARDCDVELKIGGKFEIYFNPDAPLGEKGSEDCKVLSYLPKQMLSFEWKAPPSFPNERKTEKNWVVLWFETADDKTLVKLYHLGWKTGGQWNEVYDYFDVAWSKVLEWLQKSCE